MKHFIWVMLENRSFDYMFGYRGLENEAIEGIRCDSSGRYYCTRGSIPIYHNSDSKGNKYPIKPTESVWEGEYRMDNSCLTYMKAHNNGRMDGFVISQEGREKVDLNDIMTFAPRGSFPLMDHLGDNYLLFDHFFCSVPNMTFANRSFSVAGTSMGYTHNDEFGGFGHLPCDIILTKLSEKGVKWRLYYSDTTSLLLNKNGCSVGVASQFRHVSSFENDLRAEGENFPEYVIIEPEYSRVSYEGKSFPDSSQVLLYDVYKSLRDNPIVWDKCGLFINYDETNGFYDHVVPPHSVPPSLGMVSKEGFRFDMYGPRVPALLVSPLLRDDLFGCVDTRVYDHTSILKYICDKYKIPYLSDRVKGSNDIFSGCISLTKHHTIPAIPHTSIVPGYDSNRSPVRYPPSQILEGSVDMWADMRFQEERIGTQILIHVCQFIAGLGVHISLIPLDHLISMVKGALPKEYNVTDDKIHQLCQVLHSP